MMRKLEGYLGRAGRHGTSFVIVVIDLKVGSLTRYMRLPLHDD